MYSFSLRAGHSCPGKTALCAKFCYATLGHFRQSNVRSLYLSNEERSHETPFIADMTAEIASKRVKVVRIHSSGDFYDAAYVRKWIRIIKACPRTKFYAYTRSWRVSRMLPALLELSKLPNMQLWWSCDRETHQQNGRPPRSRRIRIAFMQTKLEERVPTYVDLVFRISQLRPVVAKYVEGRLVCPVENGVETVVPITCTSCGLCSHARPIPKKSVTPNRNQLPVLT